MFRDEARIMGDWSKLLSPREHEVALLIGRGLRNKEIASELGLTLGTVKVHVHSIFLKLRTRRRNMHILLASGRAVA
jgi:two-component system, NarL family, nitrate/nitrite response regulator NarL